MVLLVANERGREPPNPARLRLFWKLRSRDITAKLNGGAGSPQDFAAWGARLQAIEKELSEKEERWLELAELG